jgi:eukaryotic-like serine/threonine-protein kinase
VNESQVFTDALKLATPAERAAFLDRACAGDPALRAAVDCLLRAHDRHPDFLERPIETLSGTLAATTAGTGPPPEPTGLVIAGRYKLLEEIGEGGMGTVWMAQQHEPVKRLVAIKLIKPGMDSKAVLARFEAERQALALMDHPNIAKVHDGGATPAGRPFFVMELVKGVPITNYCDDHRLTVRQRLELFVPVCQAVQHAHQKGVIHRDLKPSNVLVALYDERPVPKVIDFGVAKAAGEQLTERTVQTGFGAVVGTVEYMSPEQASFNNLDIDTRSDIYSLGVLLYELLTGTTPLQKKMGREVALLDMLRMIRDEDPPRPSIRLSTSEGLPSTADSRGAVQKRLTGLLRGELDWIVMKALEKDRNRRYETASAFAMDVQRYLADEPVLACPPSAGYRLRKFARRHRGPLWAAATIAVLLVVGIVASTWQAVRATKAEEDARRAHEAEARRAEGERIATADKLKHAAQVEISNAILASIFADLNLRAIREGPEPLEVVLGQRLIKAAKQLDGEAVGDPLLVADLQVLLGNALLHLGYYPEAIELCVKARNTRTVHLGADHADTLVSTNSLAMGYQNAGQFDLAQPLFEETLKYSRATLGPDHDSTVKCMSNLACCYQDGGKNELALPLLKDALKVSKAKHGVHDHGTLLVMQNLALGYQAAGKSALALSLFEETAKHMKSLLSPDHPDTLTCVCNMATCYQGAGNLDAALPLFEEALKVRKAKLGPAHPDTLVSMRSLGSCYQAAGNLDLAMPLYEESLSLAKARLGVDHPQTLMCMGSLATGYQFDNKLNLALPLYEETLKRMRTKLGEDHPQTLATMNNLAAAYKAGKRLDLALPLYEETLKLTRAKLGDENPHTLTTMHNLAMAYQAEKKPDKALPFFQSAAAGVEKRRFQHEHAERIITDLSMCLEDSKQFDEAEVWRRKWLAAAREGAGPDSVAIASLLSGLGLNLLQQKKWRDAEAVLRECLAIRAKKLPDSWLTFNTKSMLGGALLGQEQYVDAEPLLIQGYEGMKSRESKIPARSRGFLTNALERLVRLYDAQRMPDDAAKWRKELEAFRKNTAALVNPKDK